MSNAINFDLDNFSFKAFTASLGLSKILPALITLAICLLAIWLLTKLTDKLLGRSKKIDGTLGGFIRSAVRGIMWILTVIIVADALGIPTTSLVALVSVVGLALSLSVQNIMSNLFSGITLLIAKPFVAGDFVDIAGKTGTIKSMGLFYTMMDTVDNTVINIPNGDVTAASIINYSKEELRRVGMKFCASYDDATEDVKAAILEAAAEDERIRTEPAPFIALNQYKDSCIEYVVRLWCKNSDYWDVYFGMNERVRAAFDRNGISMTYEHMNVHIVEK